MQLRLLYTFIILTLIAVPAFGMEAVKAPPKQQNARKVDKEKIRQTAFKRSNNRDIADRKALRTKIIQFLKKNKDKLAEFRQIIRNHPTDEDYVESAEYVPLNQFEWFGKIPLGESLGEISIDMFGEFYAAATIQFTMFQMTATKSLLDDLRVNIGIEQQLDAPKAHRLSSGIAYDINQLTLYSTAGYRTDGHNDIKAGFAFAF